VLALLILITGVASALVPNVTAVLLVAPVTLLICERLGVPPLPFLMAEVLASNIGGTATLVGDPPNIIIGSASGLSYDDFLVNLGPLVLILIVVFIGMARWQFRGALRFHPERVRQMMSLDEREALVPGPLLPRALAVLGVVTVAFVLQGPLGYAPSVVALLGAGLLLLIAGEDPALYLREVEWQTLLFFMGIFIMVGALVKVGVIDALARRVVEGVDGHLLLAVVLLLVISGVLSGIVDNVPYVATMAPLVAALQHSIPGDAVVLWWALAIGAGLGGNATSIGASSNVVVLGLSERSGHKIRFSEWLRYGVPVTAVTLVVSFLYLWVRYFVLA
jgi:Na+/H+ antiporter NhaD/arsenite permease-like protein